MFTVMVLYINVFLSKVQENPQVCGAAVLENVSVAAGRHISFFQDSAHKFLFTLDAGIIPTHMSFI